MSTGVLLIRAAADGNAAEVERLMMSKLTTLDDAATEAAQNGHVDVVKLLLDHGANIGFVADIAAQSGQEEVVKLLLERGVSADYMVSDAVVNRRNGLLKLLLQHGADVNKVLYEAIRLDDNVSWILEEYPGAIQANDYRLAVSAALGGYVDVVEFVLHNGGATLQQKMMEMATFGGNTNVIKVLLEHGTDDVTLAKALKSAAKFGHTDVVELLLRHGVRNDKALVRAADNGQIEVVRLLLEHGAGRSPKAVADAVAAARHHPNVLELLGTFQKSAQNSLHFP